VDLSSTVAPPVLRARCLAPISAAALLSRAPAGTRYSQAQGFRPSDRVRLCRFSNRVGARLSSRIHLLRRQKTISGLSSPGQPSSWRCFGQLLSNHHPTRDARCPVKRPCGRCQPAMTRVIRIVDAPCHIPRACPASRARPRVPGPASPRSTKSAVPQARGAFHQQVPPSLPDSHRSPTAWAATGILGSSPRTQLPTCFHVPTLETLDSTAYRLFTGAEGPHAACQLLQQCVPRARHRTVQTPVKTWRTTLLPNGNASFDPSPTELSQVRGHLACLTALTPTARDRSLQWIYPNLLGSGTPCREIVPD